MADVSEHEIRADSQERWPEQWRAGLRGLTEHDPARPCVVHGLSVATGANLAAEYDELVAGRPDEPHRLPPILVSRSWRWLPAGRSERTLDLGVRPTRTGVELWSSGGGSWYGKGSFGPLDPVPGLYLVVDRAPDHLRSAAPCSHMATWLLVTPDSEPVLLCAAHGAARLSSWHRHQAERSAVHDERKAAVDSGRVPISPPA